MAHLSDVTLRPVEERDLDDLGRFATDPSLSEPFEWRGFADPGALRRRWEKDGYLDEAADSILVVALPGGSFAGIVEWRPLRAGGPVACLQIGILLLPDHRGKGLGTAAQQLLGDYLFSTTMANRLEATTQIDNEAEKRALERAGFTNEGVLRGRAFIRGRYRDGVMFSRLRDDPVPWAENPIG